MFMHGPYDVLALIRFVNLEAWPLVLLCIVDSSSSLQSEGGDDPQRTVQMSSEDFTEPTTMAEPLSRYI